MQPILIPLTAQAPLPREQSVQCHPPPRVTHTVARRRVARAYLAHGTRQDVLGAIDQRDVVAQLLHRVHVVRREEDGSPLTSQLKDLPLQQIGIDGVEPAERLIEYQQRRPMQHRHDELHLLRHPLTELLHALTPPGLDVELLKPAFQLSRRLAAAHPLEAGQKNGLIAHPHLLVEAALLWEVANAAHIGSLQRTPTQQDAPRIGLKDLINQANQRGLTSPIRAKQTIDATLRHRQAHIVQCPMHPVAFGDTLHLQQIRHHSSEKFTAPVA